MKAKILVLFCGGTMVMMRNAEGSLSSPSAEKALELIRSLEPQVFERVDVTVEFIFNGDSSNILPPIWDEIGQAIYKAYDSYDGFVIIHGTDTMAFTSSALSLSLKNLGKPVVLTGAQIPGSYINSDARLNWVNAVLLATENVAGVMILFGKSIFDGAKVCKVSHSRLDAFSSINAPLLGEVQTQIILSASARKRHEHKMDWEGGFDSKVSLILLFPGICLDFLVPSLGKELKGIILAAYGTGNISSCHLPFLQKAQDKKVPIIIRTQCLEGTTCMNIYETGRQALEYGVIEAYEMSLESSLVKLMWALDKKVPYERMRETLHQNSPKEVFL
jgi:L-asparaginase